MQSNPLIIELVEFRTQSLHKRNVDNDKPESGEFVLGLQVVDSMDNMVFQCLYPDVRLLLRPAYVEQIKQLERS